MSNVYPRQQNKCNAYPQNNLNWKLNVNKLQKHRWIFESVLSCEVQLVIVKVLHERWDKMPL